jgi:hypothetical protein
MPYNKLFINLACSVCTDKYWTSVVLYKPLPTGSVYTKKTLVRYFSVQTSRSVNKKLITIVYNTRYKVFVTLYFVQDWLYKQILCSFKPLHPLLVNLIDVFVTSVVMPLPNKHRRLAANVTVQGFSEADILTVFQVGGLELRVLLHSLMFMTPLLPSHKHVLAD